MTLSLTGRLVALAAVWAVVVLGLGAGILSNLYANASLKRFDDELGQMVVYLASAVEVDEQQTLQVADMLNPGFDRVFSGQYWQVAQHNPDKDIILARSRSLWDQDLPLLGEDDLGETVYGAATGPQAEPLRLAQMSLTVPGATKPVVLTVAYDRRPLNRDVRRFASVIIMALVALGGIMVVAVVLQVRVGLRPLYQIEQEVSAVRSGNQARLTRHYPKELRALAAELNALLDHSQSVVEKARARVGDLAHALKTPLAVLSVEAGQEQGPFADRVKDRVAAMSQFVERSLRLARATAHSTGMGAQTDVKATLNSLCQMFRKIHADKTIQFTIEGPDQLMLPLERHDLEEMFGNLLDNAAKWARTQVRVSIKTCDEGIVVGIDDDGPGLNEDERQTVLKRGERLDEAAPGSGLGLSIVRDLAEAYQADLRLARSDLGGLSVNIRFS